MKPHRPKTPDLRWLYAALIVFGAIVAHLSSEFVGMGAASDDVTFSPRHIYLGIAALAALFVAVTQITGLLVASSSARDAKRLAEIGLASLPFAGKRRFVLLTALVQFGLGGLTEIGEGCPLCGHDVGAGIAGAVLGALLWALVARLLARRLPSAASALLAFFRDVRRPSTSRVQTRAVEPATLDELHWFAPLLNRPPPSLQSL